MIRLTCANCRTQLEVDDAFAGGVCRCRHCGAIQTVPRPGRSKSGKALAGQAVSGEEPKTLYSAKSRAGLASTPSGLEELAEAVHGSGLVGSGLLNRPVPRTPISPVLPEPKSSKRLILALILTAIIIAVGIAAYVLTRDDKPTGPAASGRLGGPDTAAQRLPTFAGIPLRGNKVVFVLDRGDATSNFFPALRDLTVASVRTMGSNKLFQVVLWDNGTLDAYPALTPGYASDAEADKLAKWFDTVPTGKSTDAIPALKLAFAGQPDTAVLATGKSLQLDTNFTDSVLKLRPAHTILHAFTLGETAPEDPLRPIAQGAGGTFKALGVNDLMSMTN